MFIRNACLILAATAGLAACASADVTDITQGETFSSRAASSDQFEIQSGELALNTSSSPQVRQIAQRMITDHTKSSQELMGTLAAENSDQPEADMLPYQKRLLVDLQNSQHFDCDYLRGQEVAHMQAISLFDAYISYGDDANLKTFATQTLPVIEQHLQMIENVKNSMPECGPPHHVTMTGSVPVHEFVPIGHMCGTAHKKHHIHHHRHHHQAVQENNNQ